MAYDFLDRLATPHVKAAWAANGVDGMWSSLEADIPSSRFGDREVTFIAARDSFYLASVSEAGWPYIQHRGGPAGFVDVLDEMTLAFADFRGNRQYIGLGNIAGDDRVALFLIDYPGRRRLKILAHMGVHDLKAEPALAERLFVPSYRGRPERAFTLSLNAFDWNCPQHITARFTVPEVEATTAPLLARLAEVEAENAQLRAMRSDSQRDTLP
jgi:predicted pyridoxine 5'-phosphate oxidase superfamily flavin-nucleotide-binding protein